MSHDEVLVKSWELKTQGRKVPSIVRCQASFVVQIIKVMSGHSQRAR